MENGTWHTHVGKSYNIELETLALIFRYAINRGILLENPCDKFNRRKQPHMEIETFSRDQFSLLVTELRNSAKAVTSGAADMIEFLAYSGMRIGEAREIRRRDINFSQNTIRITGGETGTKTHRERTIPIFPSLRKQLDRIFSRRPDLPPSSRIFQIDTPRKALALACKRLGLPQFTIHSLRHFFATNAIESGISFKTVASWFGHSDRGALVARTYGHLRKEFMQDAAEKMTFHVAEASTLD